VITITNDTTLCVPPEIRLCPYCGGKLWCGFTSWSQRDDGDWDADSIDLNCENEPDLDEDDESSVEKWERWIAEHTYMPYVNWLPAEQAVLAWVNANYRFEITAAPAAKE
jgi:hypothetical protein